MFKKKKTVEQQVISAEIPEETSTEEELKVAVEEVATKTATENQAVLDQTAISIVKDKKSLTYSIICVRFNEEGDVGKPEIIHTNKDVGEAEYLFKIESVRLGIFR